MPASVSINPALQTNFAGTFFVSSDGYTQGDALDEAIRAPLRKGIVSPSATNPMYGGIPISESMSPGLTPGSFPFTGESDELQSVLAAAANITAGTAGCYTGFTVFNQATALIQTAQSRVPSAGIYGAINFYRSGSKMRIPVQALLSAATAWAGGVVDPSTVYWDTNNQWLTNATGSGIIGPLPGVWIEAINLANSRIVNWNINSSGYSTTGLLNWYETGATAVLVI